LTQRCCSCWTLAGWSPWRTCEAAGGWGLHGQRQGGVLLVLVLVTAAAAKAAGAAAIMVAAAAAAAATAAAVCPQAARQQASRTCVTWCATPTQQACAPRARCASLPRLPAAGWRRRQHWRSRGSSSRAAAAAGVAAAALRRRHPHHCHQQQQQQQQQQHQRWRRCRSRCRAVTRWGSCCTSSSARWSWATLRGTPGCVARCRMCVCVWGGGGGGRGGQGGAGGGGRGRAGRCLLVRVCSRQGDVR
jgi:hypothetical protein